MCEFLSLARQGVLRQDTHLHGSKPELLAPARLRKVANSWRQCTQMRHVSTGILILTWITNHWRSDGSKNNHHQTDNHMRVTNNSPRSEPHNYTPISPSSGLTACIDQSPLTSEQLSIFPSRSKFSRCYKVSCFCIQFSPVWGRPGVPAAKIYTLIKKFPKRTLIF